MSGKVITVTSGKGGVGKTTLTANIAAALAKTGQKVVVADLQKYMKGMITALSEQRHPVGRTGLDRIHLGRG